MFPYYKTSKLFPQKIRTCGIIIDVCILISCAWIISSEHYIRLNGKKSENFYNFSKHVIQKFLWFFEPRAGSSRLLANTIIYDRYILRYFFISFGYKTSLFSHVGFCVNLLNIGERMCVWFGAILVIIIMLLRWQAERKTCGISYNNDNKLIPHVFERSINVSKVNQLKAELIINLCMVFRAFMKFILKAEFDEKLYNCITFR